MTEESRQEVLDLFAPFVIALGEQVSDMSEDELSWAANDIAKAKLKNPTVLQDPKTRRYLAHEILSFLLLRYL
jgi:hypothetical protein